MNRSNNNAYCSTVSAVLVDTYGEPLYTCLSDSTYRCALALPDCGRREATHDSYHWTRLDERRFLPFAKSGHCDTDCSDAKFIRQAREFQRHRQDNPKEGNTRVLPSLSSPASFPWVGGPSNQRMYRRRFRMVLGGVGGFVFGGILFGPLGATAGVVIGVLLARKANMREDTNEDQVEFAYQHMVSMVQASYPYRH